MPEEVNTKLVAQIYRRLCCFFPQIILHFINNTMASRVDPPAELTSLKFDIVKLANKQMRRSLHCAFLNSCVEEGIIPSGLKLKLKIYIGKEGVVFQDSIDNLLDKVSLNICERLAEEQMKISIDIGKRMEGARDILKRKIDGNSLFNFDREVYEKTESAKNNILLKQNKKLQKLRENNRQSQLQKQQQNSNIQRTNIQTIIQMLKQHHNSREKIHPNINLQNRTKLQH